VLGDGGLGKVEGGDDIADGALLGHEEGEDIAAAGLCDGVEGVGGGGGAWHERIIFLYRNMSSIIFRQPQGCEFNGIGGEGIERLLLVVVGVGVGAADAGAG
jgi:hypothetical protein